MKMIRTLMLVTVCLFAGSAVFAKLPPLNEEQKAKAEEARSKAAETDKKSAEALAKAQDRVAERYRKEQKGKGVAAARPAATSAAIPPAK
jgi:Flp pilus assembly protein TadB